jgi:hypothetical protein
MDWRQESGLISRRTGLWVLVVITVILAAVDFELPRIPQPQSYHQFADQRGFLGVSNFGDVASNLPFAIVGVWGLVFLLRLNSEEISLRFVDRTERWPYVILFAGMVLTMFGSSYYHLHPDNARLVWDRLPMAIVFMSLVAALIMERISMRAGLWLLPVLLLVGVGSVLEWYWSEVHGAGDLRFYASVQAYSVLFLFLVLLFPPRYTRGRDLVVVAGFYVLAKALETWDKPIFGLGHVVSGHTLKHLVAGLAGYWILRMLERRRALYQPVAYQV